MTDEFDDDGLGLFRGLITAAVPSVVAWACIILVVMSLVGCGGGGDDELVPVPGVDCAVRPELCK